LYLVAVLKNAWELGGPLLKSWVQQRDLSIHTDQRKAERWAMAWLHENDVIRDEVEDQANLSPYSYQKVDGTFQDYLELCVQFGYITLFAVAFPISSFLAWIITLVEL
jgi:hypothetical protein